MPTWTPTVPTDWKRAFGLVAVPYFGRSRSDRPSGTHLLMQDGDAASFALHITPSDDLRSGRQPLGWAWSSHVRHAVVLDPATSTALVRRWDEPTFSDRRPIATERDARRFIEDIEQSVRNPSVQDVIEKTLNTFALLRDAIEERGGSSLDVVFAFNAALLLAERLRENPEQLPRVELAEAVARLREDHRPGFGGADISESVRNYPLGEFAILLEGQRAESPFLLDAGLLIRHASGRLYQEAHRRLAKPTPPARQPSLFDDRTRSRVEVERSLTEVQFTVHRVF
jgi:hypothetical protein